MMDTKTLFEDLDRLLLDWSEDRKLYYGGCCTAVFMITSCLDAYDIPYSVMMYVDRDSRYKNYPELICKHKGCLHMAVVVNYEGEETILGVDENLENILLTCTPVVKTFDNLKSKDIYRLWKDNEWVGEYDHDNDNELREEIKKIVEKNL